MGVLEELKSVVKGAISTGEAADKIKEYLERKGYKYISANEMFRELGYDYEYSYDLWMTARDDVYDFEQVVFVGCREAERITDVLEKLGFQSEIVYEGETVEKVEVYYDKNLRYIVLVEYWVGSETGIRYVSLSYVLKRE